MKAKHTLFISLLLHLLVIYVVAQSVMFPSVPDLPEKKPNVIQATLIFDLPSPPAPTKTPVEVLKEETPQPVEQKEELPVAEIPEDSQIEPIPEPEIQASPPPKVLPPQIQPPKPEEVAQEPPEQDDTVNEILPAESTTSSTTSSEIRSPATSMARRHLNSFQQQQQNRMAEQASRSYQQYKNSPVIDDEVKNPFMTEDEKFRDKLTVRADCSGATQKTTAVLLGFLGGQVDCSKPPAIEGFIQNRLNKTSHLPGQTAENQKRPQSVVIKKQP